MKKLCYLVLFLGAYSFSFAQPDAELVKKVKAKLDRVNDYQAEGKMKIDVSFIKAPQGKVKVYFKKPDKFKVKKEGGISILPKGGVSINLNSIVSTGNYAVVPTGDAMIDGIKVKVVKLLPLDEKSDVVLTTMYIDETNLLIRKSSITTRENGTYEMEMSYGKYIDWGLPDKVVFSFNTRDYKLPKGVTFEYDSGNKPKNDDVLKNKKGRVEISYSNYVINRGIDDKIFN